MSEAPTSDPIPASVLQGLAVRWLESFEGAARAIDRPGIMRLFAEDALLCGASKGGPLDSILSRNFHFEVQFAKIIPNAPCVLVVCPWHSVPLIYGAPTPKGDATVFLRAETLKGGKQRFVAYHTHFSEIKS